MEPIENLARPNFQPVLQQCPLCLAPVATGSKRIVERLSDGRGPYRMPARRKLWMKARWNKRKAIINGAEVISAAAEITAQSTP